MLNCEVSVRWYILPKYSDFIFDARLLPFQRLFWDALDCDHLSGGLLPSHHHFRKRTAAREKAKHGPALYVLRQYWQKNQWVDWRPLRGSGATVHKQHIVNIYWELVKSLTIANSLLCWLTLVFCAQPKAQQTLLKPLKKKTKHPFRTADSASSSAICLHIWEP